MALVYHYSLLNLVNFYQLSKNRGMKFYNLHEAKEHLAQLIQRASDGEEILIGESLKDAVRLVPLTSTFKPHYSGNLHEPTHLEEDLDESLDDLIDLYEFEEKKSKKKKDSK